MACGVKKQIYAITTLFLCFSVRAKSPLTVTLGFTNLSPNEVVAHKNKPLLLNCSGYTDNKYGPLLVSWFYEGELIKEGNGHKILENGSLYIDKVQSQRKRSSKRDDGIYRCMLRNKIGALLSKPIEVVIAHMAKTFTISPESVTVEEGSVARFQCQIFAVPTAVISWYQNDQPLPLSNKWYETLPSGILQIINVSKAHEGQYHCAANNEFKKRESQKFSLAVIDASTTSEPPQFLSIPSHQTVVENDTVILECLVKGSPLPKLSWRKKDRNKTESAIDSNRVTITGQGNLHIASVNVSDDGLYRCIATVPDPETGLTYEISQESTLNVHSPPRFIKYPISQEYPPALTARFTCGAVGFPIPTIQWYKNGEPLYINGRIEQVIKFENIHSLSITQTILADSGVYQCMANNSVGTVSTAARLNVTKRDNQPKPPQGLMARTLSSTSVLLSWQPSISPVGLHIQAYSVHYFPTKGGIENQIVLFDNTTQLIDKLSPFTNYSFYVRAYSDKTVSEQSETITHMTGEDIPIAAPSVKLESVSPTTIKVSWNPLPLDIARGIIRNYIIYYRRHNQPSHSKIEVSGNMLEYTITGLAPKNKYEVRVLAGTKMGFPHLPDSQWPWVLIETPGLPEAKVPPAPNLQLTVVNSSTIEAKWFVEVSDDVPPLLGYKLSYRKQGHQLKGPFQVPANVTTFLLSELALQTWYEVNIAAYNRDGDGEETARSISTLPEGSSPIKDEFIEPPSNMEGQPINSTTVKLQWKVPVNNHNISHYTVKYRVANSGKENNLTTVEYNSADNKAIISGLKPFTLYEFSVGSNDFKNHRSSFSLKIECRTLEDKPGPPRDVSWIPLNQTSIRLSWQAPLEENGEILAYYVMYKIYKTEVEKEQWKKVPDSKLDTIITDIMTNVSYSLAVKAETKAGQGPSSPILSIKIPGQRNNTGTAKTITDRKLSVEGNDPFLGIILGVAIGVFCIIICVFIILFRNRCLTFANHDTNFICCCGKVEQIPRENGTLPQLERGGHKRIEGSDLQEMAPMLTQIPDDNHLDTKGGYPLTNGHANGIHYSTGDQNHKPYANGIAINRTNPPHDNHKGILPPVVKDNDNEDKAIATSIIIKENSSILTSNGPKKPVVVAAVAAAPSVAVVPRAMNGSASKDQKPDDKNCFNGGKVITSNGGANSNSKDNESGAKKALENTDKYQKLTITEGKQQNSVCNKYTAPIATAHETEKEPSLNDSQGESDDEANASVSLLLPSKFSQPNASNATAV